MREICMEREILDAKIPTVRIGRCVICMAGGT